MTAKDGKRYFRPKKMLVDFNVQSGIILMDMSYTTMPNKHIEAKLGQNSNWILSESIEDLR